jgi:sulfite reductase beta subunit-like hemoprotein
MSRRRRTPICAGCAFPTASSSIGNSPASPIIAERYGGGYAHVTTRANLQIREIEPKNAVAVVEAIQDLGLCSRGSGADNIRNVTGTPTAGIDPQELLDTRPYARDWHFHILNERALYGLPRKFNVAFDGAGAFRRWRTPTTSASRR